MRAKLLALLLVAGAALALAAVAGADNGGFTPVAPRSPNAGRINDAYYLILGLTGAIFVIVESALVVFVVRFRNRGRARDIEGPQIRGNTRLELIWTVVPVLILAAIGGFVFAKLPGIKNVPAARAGNRRIPIRVGAHQYYWQFEYPNGVIAIDKLRAPVGEVVTLDVTSPDVAHAWWIPALGGKIDAIPGRTNRTWFRATRVGTYQGQCAELCGLFHSTMLASVEVMPKADFDRWLSAQSAAQQARTSDLGAQVFTGVCSKCHGDQGQGAYGPRIAGNPLLQDERGIEALLRNGRRLMPAVGKTWSDAQMSAVTAYLKKTQGNGPSGG